MPSRGSSSKSLATGDLEDLTLDFAFSCNVCGLTPSESIVVFADHASLRISSSQQGTSAPVTAAIWILDCGHVFCKEHIGTDVEFFPSDPGAEILCATCNTVERASWINGLDQSRHDARLALGQFKLTMYNETVRARVLRENVVRAAAYWKRKATDRHSSLPRDHPGRTITDVDVEDEASTQSSTGAHNQLVAKYSDPSQMLHEAIDATNTRRSEKSTGKPSRSRTPAQADLGGPRQKKAKYNRPLSLDFWDDRTPVAAASNQAPQRIQSASVSPSISNGTPVQQHQTFYGQPLHDPLSSPDIHPLRQHNILSSRAMMPPPPPPAARQHSQQKQNTSPSPRFRRGAASSTSLQQSHPRAQGPSRTNTPLQHSSSPTTSPSAISWSPGRVKRPRPSTSSSSAAEAVDAVWRRATGDIGRGEEMNNHGNGQDGEREAHRLWGGRTVYAGKHTRLV